MRVAVIGGGIVGTAAAGYLARQGASVTLYEREALAAGASGRNSGVVQQPFDEPFVPLFRESVELYRELNAAVGRVVVRVDEPPVGLLLVSHRPEAVLALAASLAARYPELRPEAVEDVALQRLEPALASDVVACRVELGYPVIPSAPTYAFATVAERAGVAIRLGRDARPAIRAGRCLGVEIGGAVEEADAVLVAAGPWSAELVDADRRRVPVEARWGVVVDTLLPNPPRHVMEEAEMDEALGTAAVGAPGVSSSQPGDSYDFSLISAGGSSAVGSTFLRDEPEPEAWMERLLVHGASFVPTIADAPIREIRACARPASADGRPIVGAVPWCDGLYLATGHGPWGISGGPASARQVADLILGRPVRIDPAFAVDRFGTAA